MATATKRTATKRTAKTAKNAEVVAPELAAGVPVLVEATAKAVEGGDAFVASEAPDEVSPKAVKAREERAEREAKDTGDRSERDAEVDRKAAREARIKDRLANARANREKRRANAAKIDNISFTGLTGKDPQWMVTETLDDGTEKVYTGSLAGMKGSQMVVSLANEAIALGREASDKQEDTLAETEDGV